MILVVQNVVQPIVQTKFTKDALDLHRSSRFGSTIVGTALAGILGCDTVGADRCHADQHQQASGDHKELRGEPSS